LFQLDWHFGLLLLLNSDSSFTSPNQIEFRLAEFKAMKAEAILEQGRKLLKTKGEDYTEDRDKNQFQNFDRSNLVASWFKNDDDKSFAVLIGVKLARLASLLSSDKDPNNESIQDSFVDLVNYAALWAAYRATLDE
jgi:hypothetical protein